MVELFAHDVRVDKANPVVISVAEYQEFVTFFYFEIVSEFYRENNLTSLAYGRAAIKFHFVHHWITMER
jgi:hypothetical protein